ncbi:MAG: glycosyltransferase family 2 protein [Oscillospiraceae bacterium]|nr:glycosyltransferase family 2 protein [Oscillospiraceae bacterium]
MQTLKLIYTILSVLFALCCSYQLIYIPIALIGKRRNRNRIQVEGQTHRYAVLIPARNEERCIPDLIRSIRSQDYPQEKIRVFVLADNCTDDTAQVARDCGATVYTRTDPVHIGKGYALSELLRCIRRDEPVPFDGYFVFDADNILAEDFIRQMDRCFSQGNDIVHGYRNSKNFGDSWISAGHSLWFLRSTRFLSGAREEIGSSCHISGTGFLFSERIRQSMEDWPYHLLTEDFEFTVDQVLRGERVAFCEDAEFFDEQPTDLATSWRQRTRWAQGYIQVAFRYVPALFKGAIQGNWSCFDYFITALPGYILSFLSAACRLAILLLPLFTGAATGPDTLSEFLRWIGSAYLTVFLLGAVTTLSERDHILASPVKKILSMITFPLYMATFLPISVLAVFTKPQWSPIPHTVTVRDLQEEKGDLKKVSNF